MDPETKAEPLNDEQVFEQELDSLTKTKTEPIPETVKPEDTTKTGETINGEDKKPGTAKNAKAAQDNTANAFRRIQNKNVKLQNKVAELYKRIEELEGSSKPEDILESNRLTTEANTYSTIINAQEVEEWENRAYSVFGADAENFIQKSKAFAQHVNENEPELNSYINRPYGFILLNEWYNQMADVQNANEWQHLTSYEKGRVLDSFYSRLLDLASRKKEPVVNNVPTPTGGKNTNGTAPSDDFAMALVEAQRKFARK